MPIYEYRCDSCGFQKEYIQRMSEARLTDCPECKKATFNKMVTAAGFQLKGGGWYVTDFKTGGSNTKPPVNKGVEKQSDASGKSESTGSDKSVSTTAAASASSSVSATPAAAPAAASAPSASSAPATASGS